jgi:hypothetical protein
MDRKQLQDELEKSNTQLRTEIGAKLEETNTQLGAKIDALAAASATERDNVSALRGASELLLKLVRWYGLM